MNPKDFTIGQTVFVEPYRARGGAEPEPHAITKIGRQWVTYGEGWREGRFNPRTMRVDSGGGHARAVWLSLEERAAHLRAQATWSRFQDRVRDQYVAPRGLPAEIVERWIAEFDAAKAAG